MPKIALLAASSSSSFFQKRFGYITDLGNDSNDIIKYSIKINDKLVISLY